MKVKSLEVIDDMMLKSDQFRPRSIEVNDRPQRLPSNLTKCYDLGFKNGSLHGFDEFRQEVLTFLETKYLRDDDRPDRGTPKADAILDLARELSVFMTDLKLRKIR